MANSSFYNLNLNDFGSSIRTAWEELRQQNDFCDVTLASEGKQIEAHKVILSGFSPVFKDLLKQNTHPHPLLYLRGVKYCELVNILDFIYQGEISIEKEQLNNFVHICREFQIKGLANDVNMQRFGSDDQDYHQSKKRKISKENEKQLTFIKSEPNLIQSENDFFYEHDEDTILGLSDYACHDYEYCEEDKHEDLKETKESQGRYDSQIEEEENDENFISVRAGKEFICPICDKVYARSGVLNRHVKEIHDGITYPCYQCDYRTTRKVTLKKHFEALHKDLKFEGSAEENNFESDIIQKEKGFHTTTIIKQQEINNMENINNDVNSVSQFSKSLSMSEDEDDPEKNDTISSQTNEMKEKKYQACSSSTGKKQLVCKYCNKAFNQSGSLNRHIKSVHIGVRYACDHCDYSSKEKAAIKRHFEKYHEQSSVNTIQKKKKKRIKNN